jgi:hypothetical protein
VEKFSTVNKNTELKVCKIRVKVMKITCRYQFIYIYIYSYVHVTHLHLEDNVKIERSYILALLICLYDVDGQLYL